MRIDETTTVDAKDAFEDVEVAVFPIGSTEQHGPALPLCTDTSIGSLIASGVEDRDDAVVLPTIPISISPHHRHFHGTAWVSAETFEQYLREIIANYTVHGIEKAVIVNAHGGNVAAISRVGQRLYREETAFVMPWSWWEGVDPETVAAFDPDLELPGHAAGVEASMMYLTQPELLREDRFEEAAAGTGPGSRFEHPDFRGYDFADWTANGIHGDPTKATVEIGEALYEEAVETLHGIIDWLAAMPPEECKPRQHK